MADPATGTSEPNELAAVVGVVWSERKTRDALGLDAAALVAQQEEGEVLALTAADGTTVFPVFQFQRHEDSIEVRRALVPVLRALRPFDPWAVAVVLRTPSPELDGSSPLNWLDAGGSPEAVAHLGEVIAREWAAGSQVSQ